MIKTTNNDLKRVLDYIGDDYAKCLYIYLDIKEYGLESENIKLWIQEKDNEIKCIVMKYYTGMHIYSKNTEFDKYEVIELIKKEEPKMISSMSNIADYVNYIPEGYLREDGFVMKVVPNQPSNPNASKATREDIAEICHILETDIELGIPYGYDLLYKQLSERFDSGYGRNWVIRENGEIVAHCATYADGYGVSVHGGLIVRDDHKGRGLGVEALRSLANDVIKDGKELIGYVYTPAAIKTHERAGREVVGKWTKIYI